MKATIDAITVVLMLVLSSPTGAMDESACPDLHRQFNEQHRQIMAAKNRSARSIHHAMLVSLEKQVFGALEKCPNNALLFALMGEVQITLGQPYLAVLYGHRSQELDPSCWQGFYVAGTALCLSGKYEACFEELEQAVKREPDNLGLRLNLCSSQVWAQRYKEAEQSCSQVIDKGGQKMQARAYFLRGRARQELGDTSRASTDLDKAARLGFDPQRDQLQIFDPAAVDEAVSKQKPNGGVDK
jgi:tetratricopeptide (TPR) repeat protein